MDSASSRAQRNCPPYISFYSINLSLIRSKFRSYIHTYTVQTVIVFNENSIILKRSSETDAGFT